MAFPCCGKGAEMDWNVLSPDSILVQNKPQDLGEAEGWNSKDAHVWSLD